MKSVNVKESGRTVKRQSIIAIDGMHTQLMKEESTGKVKFNAQQ